MRCGTFLRSFLAPILAVGCAFAVVTGCSSPDELSTPSSSESSIGITTESQTPVPEETPSDDDSEFRSAMGTYQYKLEEWLNTTSVDWSQATALLLGTWTIASDPVTYIVFDEETFWWYDSNGTTSNSYMAGLYQTAPGCGDGTSFGLTVEDQPCFSVFFNYTHQVIEAETTQINTYEMWYVVGTRDAPVTIVDYRSGNSVTATLAA